MRFTSVAVEKLRPQETRVEYLDALIPSLRLRITPRGRKVWSTVYWVKGRKKRYTIGRHPLVGLKQAREEAQRILDEAERGNDPNLMKQEAKFRSEHYTFKAVAEQFIERYAKKKNRSWQQTESTLSCYVYQDWASKPIADITRLDVIALLDRLEDGDAKSVPRHVFAAIRKLFNWAAERGIIEHSPCLHITPPAKPKSRDRVLSDDEVKKLWCTTRDHEQYPFGYLLQFLLATGQRLREASEMTWDEVDRETGLWTIPRERAKADRAQTVPLSPLALEILDSLPRFKGKYVFTTSGGERPFSGFSKAKKRVETESGVTEWRIHDLRRTAGTGMAKIGVPRDIISHVLNHAQNGVTAIYDRHTYLPEKKAALEKWGAYLQELVSET